MSKVRDLINGSLKLIQVLASGETADAAMQADAFAVLNAMIGSWSTERLLILASSRESFSLVNGQQSYTIGPSGNFDTVRPQSVDIATIQLSSSPDYEIPLEIVGVEKWTAITAKDIRSSIPTQLYVENTYPLATLNFWPVPTGSAGVVLVTTKPFSEFASVNTDLSFAPGYFEALKYNLAMRLAPEYGKPIDPALGVLATESKTNIKRQNSKQKLMISDAPTASRGSTSPYKIYSGS